MSSGQDQTWAVEESTWDGLGTRQYGMDIRETQVGVGPSSLWLSWTTVQVTSCAEAEAVTCFRCLLHCQHLWVSTCSEGAQFMHDLREQIEGFQRTFHTVYILRCVLGDLFLC